MSQGHSSFDLWRPAISWRFYLLEALVVVVHFSKSCFGPADLWFALQQVLFRAGGFRMKAFPFYQ